jgi:hypothetical protein
MDASGLDRLGQGRERLIEGLGFLESPDRDLEFVGGGPFEDFGAVEAALTTD